MNPEREAMDAEFGAFENEFQAAFALSQMEAPADDRAEIERAVKAGRFVVVASTPRYCALTDALMGEFLTLLSEHSTFEEAEAAMVNALDEGDVWYTVRGPKAAPATVVPSGDEDEDNIPF